MNVLYPNTKINGIELDAASRGWICKIYFGHQTHRQETYEHHAITANGPWGWTGLAGMVVAFLFAVARCAVFAYRSRRSAGPYHNAKTRNIGQRVIDWLIGLIDDRAGEFEVY